MTTERRDTKGEMHIQYPEVTSSSPVFKLSYDTCFLIRGRKSYRTFLRAPPNPIHRGPSTRVAFITVLGVFVTFLLVLFYIYREFPNVTEDERPFIKIPYSIEDAKNLGIVLNRYKGDHYYQVMAAVFCVYIFLQTFAIPGSLFLSILSGFLFPFWFALGLVCTCSAVGATLCFFVSRLLGRRFVLAYWPERVAKWERQVDAHRDNLLNYVIFLRVTPLVPNWFINLSAPVIGVPAAPFAIGTFIGVAPPSFLAIQAGQTLNKMTSTDTAFGAYSIAMLAFFGIISLLPVMIKTKFHEKVQ